MRFKASTVMALAIFYVVPGPVQAQMQFPLEMPAPKVGDTAKYRTIDLWNNTEISTSQTDIVEIQSERLITRSTSSTNSTPRTNVFTREWQPCRRMRGNDQPVCTGSLKFPMQLQDKHSYDKLPWPNGNGHTSGACQVKGEEKITVPAGAFATVRIECTGFWNRIYDQSDSGKMTELYWYAPSVARIVKSQYFDFNNSGSAVNKTQTEMIEFTAAK